jgi:hypothetical protein
MDTSNIFEYLQDHVKRKLLNLLFTMPFWVIPFILFKPSIFQLPIYVQFCLIFCLSSLWYLLNVFFVIWVNVIFFKSSEKFEEFVTEATTISSIILLSIIILFSYYHSMSVTELLCYCFGSVITLNFLCALFSLIEMIVKFIKNG